MGFWPPMEQPTKLGDSLIEVAPDGLACVHTMMCGTCANENAVKAALMCYQRRERGGSPPSLEDLQSCVKHQPPGTPQLSVLSFEGAFHGRTLGMLSVSHNAALGKVDIPVIDNWPRAPFPHYKYPLDANLQYNKQQDEMCLEKTKSIFAHQRSEGLPIACVIVEPIQSEGGDRHGSPSFFRSLRQLCSEQNAYLIVDEVQTGGGATGRWWTHENWGLDDPPDFVTFSKKMQIAGFYYRQEHGITEPTRIQNTWMGDPVRLRMFDVVKKVVEENNLLERTTKVGQTLLSGLEELCQTYPDKISNARGQGLFAAIDCENTEQRDKMLRDALQRGLHLGPCNVRTIRFRPALIFEERHCQILLDIFNETLKHF